MDNKQDSMWHWTPDLSVGVEAIDNDHKWLFHLLYEAHLVSDKETNYNLINKLADELLLYTESHFKREEAIMAASDYPFCHNHAAIHRDIVKQLKRFLQQCKDEDGSGAQFIDFLRTWFVDHINGTDKRIGQYTLGCESKIEQALLQAGPLTIPQSVNIYVVDDDPLYVDVLVSMVEMAGLRATGFTSSSAFVNQSILDHDIILLDLNMPDLDGIEVMRILSDRDCLPSYILISGFDDRVLHSATKFAEAKDITVIDTFTKPVSHGPFIECINKVYGERKLALDKSDSVHDVRKKLSPQQNISLTELKTAIEKHQFVLYYHPQLNIKSKTIRGFEALIRLQHPTKGLIAPDRFIGLAEQQGLICAITEEVINLVAADYPSFCNVSTRPQISINISAHDLEDLSMPERTSRKFSARNIPPEAITIELTESAIFASDSGSLDVLNRLRMKGFSLSIDDFGTGSSSLSHLYQAPFTELKIDQSFVMNMLEDEQAMSIVKICISLAKELNMESVAEGAATQEIWDELARLGCDTAQGYVIEKPMPLSQCLQWITNHRQKIM